MMRKYPTIDEINEALQLKYNEDKDIVVKEANGLVKILFAGSKNPIIYKTKKENERMEQ